MRVARQPGQPRGAAPSCHRDRVAAGAAQAKRQPRQECRRQIRLAIRRAASHHRAGVDQSRPDCRPVLPGLPPQSQQPQHQQPANISGGKPCYGQDVFNLPRRRGDAELAKFCGGRRSRGEVMVDAGDKAVEPPPCLVRQGGRRSPARRGSHRERVWRSRAAPRAVPAPRPAVRPRAPHRLHLCQPQMGMDEAEADGEITVALGIE